MNARNLAPDTVMSDHVCVPRPKLMTLVRFNDRVYQVRGYQSDGSVILRPPSGGVEEWVSVADCVPVVGDANYASGPGDPR